MSKGGTKIPKGNRPHHKVVNQRASVKKAQVAITYCHPPEVSAFFHASLLGVLTGTKTAIIDPIIGILSGPKIDESRNEAVRRALENPEVTHILMVDADMVLQDRTVDTLLAHDKDIVGGLCFTSDPHGAIVRPTIGQLHQTGPNEKSIDILWDYPIDELVQCDATGAACVLIKREVFERMLEARGADHPLPWYAHGLHGNTVIGEDIAFCLTARALNFEVWVDTGLITLHVKPHFVGPIEYVQSLSRKGHPCYDDRETVPMYQEIVNGNARIQRDKPSGAELPDS